MSEIQMTPADDLPANAQPDESMYKPCHSCGVMLLDSFPVFIKVLRKLDEMKIDRDEWKQQHENLLSVRQSDLTAALAARAERDAEIERLKSDFEIAFRERNDALKASMLDQQRLIATEARVKELEEACAMKDRIIRNLDPEASGLREKLEAAEARVAELEERLMVMCVAQLNGAESFTSADCQAEIDRVCREGQERYRTLFEIHTKHGIEDTAARQRLGEQIVKLRVLLEEAVTGFSRVLVGTSDQERVYDWVKRVKAELKAISTVAGPARPGDAGSTGRRRRTTS